jgi:hypothetical protein
LEIQLVNQSSYRSDEEAGTVRTLSFFEKLRHELTSTVNYADKYLHLTCQGYPVIREHHQILLFNARHRPISIKGEYNNKKQPLINRQIDLRLLEHGHHEVLQYALPTQHGHLEMAQFRESSKAEDILQSEPFFSMLYTYMDVADFLFFSPFNMQEVFVHYHSRVNGHIFVKVRSEDHDQEELQKLYMH